jgi:hypothetical protein
MSANDNMIQKSKDFIAYHLYGIDQIITDNHDIKFIEINGAPRLYRYEEIAIDIPDGHINYNVLINQVLKNTVDIIYHSERELVDGNDMHNNGNLFGKFKDSISDELISKREFIQCYHNVLHVEHEKNKKFYVSQKVRQKYEFIYKAVYHIFIPMGYTFTKNPHDPNIFFFYGDRDRYYNDLTNMFFYDEVLDYKQSECSSNATIVNKIQGITYYLGSKDRLYKMLLDKNSSDIVDKFHPKSKIICTDTPINCSVIKTYFEGHNSLIDKIFGKHQYILKPAYGSQGKGIVVFNDIAQLNKMIEVSNETCTSSVYILSAYINNPKLYKINLYNPISHRDTNGRKFNLRFYVLITLDDLPTYYDLSNNTNKKRCINYYILDDVQVYFALSEYNDKTKPRYIDADISDDTFYKTKNLTNLEIINQINLQTKNKIDTSQFITGFDSMNYPREYKDNIRKKFADICNITLNSVKDDLRNINRHQLSNDYSPKAFNLTAYDTMIDTDDKLWLIEINRGPDLVGLQKTIGTDKIYNVFSDMFNIVLFDYEESKHWKKYTLSLP